MVPRVEQEAVMETWKYIVTRDGEQFDESQWETATEVECEDESEPEGEPLDYAAGDIGMAHDGEELDIRLRSPGGYVYHYRMRAEVSWREVQD